MAEVGGNSRGAPDHMSMNDPPRDDDAENAYDYKKPEEVSFAYKARERVNEMWHAAKTSKVVWLFLGCGLLVIVSVVTAAVLASFLIAEKKEANSSKDQDGMVMGSNLKDLGPPPLKTSFEANSTPQQNPHMKTTDPPSLTTFCKEKSTLQRAPHLNKSGTPIPMTLCEENGLAAAYLTSGSSPAGFKGTESSKDVTTAAETFPTTVASLSTTDQDVCIMEPCQHGRCLNKEDKHTCLCDSGWTGQNCQQGCQDGNGVSYRGIVAVTKSGKTCQRWDRHKPHKHMAYTPAKYPSSGLEQNYCRNPEGGLKPWCYTMDPGTKWELCDVPLCAHRCRSGWSEYNNHCYKLMMTKVTWPAANSLCKRTGANLAAVMDYSEKQFIIGLIYGGKTPLVWFGLYKDARRWKWTDGSRVSYTNWARGEPNNHIYRGENCAGVYSKKKKKRGEWNNAPCGHKYPYICKINPLAAGLSPSSQEKVIMVK